MKQLTFSKTLEYNKTKTSALKS